MNEEIKLLDVPAAPELRPSVSVVNAELLACVRLAERLLSRLYAYHGIASVDDGEGERVSIEYAAERMAQAAVSAGRTA